MIMSSDNISAANLGKYSINQTGTNLGQTQSGKTKIKLHSAITTVNLSNISQHNEQIFFLTVAQTILQQTGQSRYAM